MMRQLTLGKLLGLAIFLVLANLLADRLFVRWDLTETKRFTLAPATKKLLSSLQDPVRLTIFMSGGVKASDKKFVKELEGALLSFQSYARGKMRYEFVNPFSTQEDSTSSYLLDSLSGLGLRPYTLRAQDKSILESKQRVIIPGAILEVGGRAKAINFFEGLRITNEEELFARAASLFEYQLASALEKLTQERRYKIYYSSSHSEPMDLRMIDFFQTVAQHYIVDTLNLISTPIPSDADVLMIFSPQTSFREEEKIKLDHYVMQGGKVVFYLGGLKINHSKETESGDMFFVSQAVNLDDLLFSYGCRLEYGLLKDLQSATMPIVVGEVGGRPQISSISWPYYPLLNTNTEHVITKNLDPVMSKYTTWLSLPPKDSLKATVLLSSSSHAQIVGVPAKVSISEAQHIDPVLYTKSNLPVGVLLEGRFQSLYYSRLIASQKQEIERTTKVPFKSTSTPTSILVVANPQILINDANQHGMIPMGYVEDMNFTFSNKSFLLNSLSYMCNPDGIIAARSKDMVVQLLDRERVVRQASFWKAFNLLIPLLIPTLLMGFLYVYRWRKYHLKAKLRKLKSSD